jgi:hypothetical protein
MPQQLDTIPATDLHTVTGGQDKPSKPPTKEGGAANDNNGVALAGLTSTTAGPLDPW